jgi:hypothetical protein
VLGFAWRASTRTNSDCPSRRDRSSSSSNAVVKAVRGQISSWNGGQSLCRRGENGARTRSVSRRKLDCLLLPRGPPSTPSVLCLMTIPASSDGRVARCDVAAAREAAAFAGGRVSEVAHLQPEVQVGYVGRGPRRENRLDASVMELSEVPLVQGVWLNRPEYLLSASFWGPSGAQSLGVARRAVVTVYHVVCTHCVHTVCTWGRPKFEAEYLTTAKTRSPVLILHCDSQCEEWLRGSAGEGQ